MGRADLGTEPVRRLRRAERRSQILEAATRAFARTGFAHTSLDDIAAEAGITRVLLYRHFDSKADLYRAVLDGVRTRLMEAVDVDDLTSESVPALVRAAAADPDGFRLLFRHTAREPEFREFTDRLASGSTEIARRGLAEFLPEGPWLEWSARIIPVFTIEAVISWLDAGRPDPDLAGERIGQAIDGIIRAARPS